MSMVYTLLHVGTDRVCCGIMLSLDGSGWLEVLLLFRPICGWFLSLSLFLRGILLLVVVPMRGSSFGSGVSSCFFVILFACLFFYFTLEIIRYWVKCTSNTYLFFWTFSYTFSFLYLYIIYLSFKKKIDPLYLF
jgi:hypothetical protein